jgi:predicted Zn-dependent protease
MSNDRIERARLIWQKNPDHELARFNLAQAYFDAADYPRAVEFLRPLCASKPDWMVVHILLGKSLIALAQISEARPILEHALQLAIAQHHDGPREELTELLNTL